MPNYRVAAKSASKQGKYEPDEIGIIWRLASHLKLDRKDLYKEIYGAAKATATSREAVQDTFSKAFSSSPWRNRKLTEKNRAYFCDALETVFRKRRKQVVRADIERFVDHPSDSLLQRFAAAPELAADPPAASAPVTPELEARWSQNCYFEISRLQGQYHLPMDACLDWAEARFRNNPDDAFLLAILTWNIFGRGSAQRIRTFAPVIKNFLDPGPPAKTSFDFPAWSLAVDALQNGSLNRDDSMFLRRHLDDALGRAAILTYLREEGNTSWLANRIRNAAGLTEMPHQVARIFELPDGPNWVGRAIEAANNWCNVDTTSATARINLLWLLGRQEAPDPIRGHLERVCRWLDQHPRHDDAALRWITIWLAGMADHHVETVLHQSREWLAREQAIDDRAVRLGYFWLVGEKGIRDDVATAFSDARSWFRGRYRDDRTTRIGHLIWLVTRTYIRGFISKQQFSAELDAYRGWAAKRQSDGIVTAALVLAASLERSLP